MVRVSLILCALFCILIAYGVGPSLNVGFEEALFLASKIKANLGGSLSLEKTLYLLFITLQTRSRSKEKKVEVSLTIKRQKFTETDQSQNSDVEDNERTFRAFIIRYLYYLRE